jgi:hypothetical protein
MTDSKICITKAWGIQIEGKNKSVKLIQNAPKNQDHPT